MTREEALKKVEKYDGKLDPQELKWFCDFVGIKEDEFWKISKSFRGKKVWMKNNNGEWAKKIE